MSAAVAARRILSGAIMIALLAAAMLVYSYHERDYDKAYAPLMKYGAVGQAVDAGPFSVKVDKVQVAKTVSEGAYEGYVAPLRTSAGTVFVVIDARITATTDGMKLPYVVLRNGDTLYGPSTKSAAKKLTDSVAQPGYWIAGAYLFELPASAVAGTHLQIGNQTEYGVPRQTFPHLGFELNPGADVDLGLSAAQAAHPKDKVTYREPEE